MKTYQKIFPSISALSAYVNTDPVMTRRDHTASRSTESGVNMDTKEARSRAAEGGYYPEGAKNIEPIQLNADQLNARDLALPVPVNSIAGYRANVPAYLCGSPYSMVYQAPQDKPNRLLKIAVHIGKPASMPQSATFNRGNAILSILNALHELGFALELWALWRNSDGGTSRKGGSEVSIETCIKQADQSYSPDSIAFSICNDGFQKRLIWRVAEMALADHKCVMNVLDSGYGNGLNAVYDDFDLSFGWTKYHRYFDSKSQTLDRMVEHAAGQLDKLRGAA